MCEVFADPTLAGNEQIEKAIHLFHQTPTEHALLGVCMAIRALMLADGHLVFPADIQEDGAGAQVFAFKTMDFDQTAALVAFTSYEELQKGPETPAVSQFIDSMLEQLLQVEEIGGLILNPWGESVFMGKEDIALILTPGSERFV